LKGKVNKDHIDVRCAETNTNWTKDMQTWKSIIRRNEKTGLHITKSELHLDAKISKNEETKTHRIEFE